ncbi:ATP-binding protein [Actinomadura sp. HBU206391]|uniref:ATP-binding protein n=1 Tax=Actinomadura sp. HBU206391 TaxID=2731692 RepID=UPI00164FF3D0|nr:hypothetical protein [Actinomadura sp. HBU206391]MBC6462744.1 hypothetical protein [Actinomadura sp. HBU206391]
MASEFSASLLAAAGIPPHGQVNTSAVMSTPASGSASIRAWDCAAWWLPHNETCNAVARHYVRETFNELGLARTLVDDCLTMLSELVTNAFVHGLGGKSLDERHAPSSGRCELWLYRRGQAPHTELVCKVFDPQSDWPIPKPPAHDVLDLLPELELSATPSMEALDAILPGLQDGARGLDLVRTLSHGRTGFHRTRSRLGQWPVPGKVAWFSLPIPGPSQLTEPPRVEVTAPQASQQLKEQLLVRGIDTIRNAERDHAVLSVRRGLTVWCHDNAFRWHVDGTSVRRPYAEITDVTETIVALHEDLRHAE